MNASKTALFLLPLALLFTSLSKGASPLPESQPGEFQAGAWLNDRTWYDGKAEKCIYEATRTLYGVERRYDARAYTNKQQMDPRTTTKSASGQGVEVFKHHWSERVPTAAYDYDFSTATFSRTSDLQLFKLTASTQEDCGASFKQATREGDSFVFFESSYFPGDGVRTGKLDRAQDLVAEDALPLVLRNYPFDAPKDLALSLIPTQKDTHAVRWEPVPHTVRSAGTETLTLPAGEFAAHRLDLFDGRGTIVSSFWFSASGEAPLLHVLLKAVNPRGGTSYELKSHERTAYWERG